MKRWPSNSFSSRAPHRVVMGAAKMNPALQYGHLWGQSGLLTLQSYYNLAHDSALQ